MNARAETRSAARGLRSLRMHAAHIVIVGMAIGAAAMPVDAAPDRVALRNGDIIEGQIQAIDAGGVSLRRTVARSGDAAKDGAARSLEVTERIGWDRVATLEHSDGRRADDEAEVERLLELGERLWRARARMMRGDVALAEEALGPAWNFEPSDEPTGVVAALVELQVALARHEHARAWRAWLEVARWRGAGHRDATLETWVEPSASGVLMRRTLVDEATGLCPSLPPFVDGDEERAEVLAALDDFDPRGDRVLDALRHALASVIDPGREPPQAEDDPKAEDARAETDPRRTLAFLRTLRMLQHGMPAERADARSTIVSQRRRLPEWAEAWSRYAAGVGLRSEETPAAALAAQVELMHLPARFADSQPWLTARGAAIAAEISRRAGLEQEAAQIDRIVQPMAPTTPTLPNH